jgi:predicted HicB family RNase H-like nuclease
MMQYKGYTAHVEYDDDAKIFYGEVVGLKDVITFQGRTVDEIEKSLKDSVDDYLAWCGERGEKPEKAFSGTFNLRIPPDLHARLALQAKTMGMSLNSYITDQLYHLYSKPIKEQGKRQKRLKQ